jgi:polyphosphate glucokinase
LGQLLTSDGKTLSEALGHEGLRRAGKRRWRRTVAEVSTTLMSAFVVDYVVLGGGNAKEMRLLPPGARLGHNLAAFRGGFRLWHLEDVQTLDAENGRPFTPRPPADWRVI